MQKLSDEDRQAMARARRFTAIIALGAALLFGCSHLYGARAADSAAPSQQGTPDTIVEGSPNVTINGVAVARQGDKTLQGTQVVTGSPNVLINGKPAVLSGDKTGCNGIVIGTSTGVFINGKPVARSGDVATACPGK
jgi:uncharacterized Zn-binding protein involved in type VI secretion